MIKCTQKKNTIFKKTIMKRILEIQQNIGKLSKNSSNPFFKSQYLDLNDLLTHVTPLLNEKGLVLLQPIEDGNVASTIVDSENNEVIAQSYIALPPTLTDPQKLGSCITYFRRYTLKSLLAIAEGDDDGNAASKPTPTEKKPLDNAGLKYLRENGTLEQLNTALNGRILTNVQKEVINELIKKLQK